MEIYDHAVHRYIGNVLGISEEDSNEYYEEYAKEQIEKGVRKPDFVYHGEEEMPQIHVRRDACIVVGVETDSDGELRPYKNKQEKMTIPTVYNRNEFMSNKDEEEGKVEA